MLTIIYNNESKKKMMDTTRVKIYFMLVVLIFISFGFNVLIGIFSIIVAIVLFLFIRNKKNNVLYNKDTRKYCTICGSDNPSEAQYCQVCGHSLKFD